MKRIMTLTLALMALTACGSPPAQAGVPNPASVYCEQNGNEHAIRTSDDGSQSGLCIFPDGGTCDEWAYYLGECGGAAHGSPTPALTVDATRDASGGGPGGGSEPGGNASGGFMPPGTSEEVARWWGVIKSPQPSAQYDDCFERQDLGQITYFGIEPADSTVQAQIEALRDSGRIVHLYGTLFSNVPDCNGSQILVDRIDVED